MSKVHVYRVEYTLSILCYLNAITSMMVVQGISYAVAKKKKGMTVGFVTFETVEQLKNAVEVIVYSFVLATCLAIEQLIMNFCLTT